jgi:hypothetical protein
LSKAETRCAVTDSGRAEVEGLGRGEVEQGCGLRLREIEIRSNDWVSSGVVRRWPTGCEDWGWRVRRWVWGLRVRGDVQGSALAGLADVCEGLGFELRVWVDGRGPEGWGLGVGD